MSIRICDASIVVGEGVDRFEISVSRLDLPSATCAAIIGPSGAGKTSVLEFVGLMRTPRAVTSLEIAGFEARGLAMADRISARAAFRSKYLTYVIQSGGVLPYLSVRENVLAGLRAAGKPVDAVALERLSEGAARLGMNAVLDKRRHQLSGGERRRVGLLRAFVASRPVVVVDEPTSALDADSADRAIAVLRALAEESGATVLVVTHDEQRVREAGYTVFNLRLQNDGRLRELVATDVS